MNFSLVHEPMFGQPTSNWTYLSLQCLVVSLKHPFCLILCFFPLARIGFDFSLFLSLGWLQTIFISLLVSWMNFCCSPHFEKV